MISTNLTFVGSHPILDGTSGTATGLTGFALRDTSAAYDVTVTPTSSTTLTAGRVLTIDVVNASRTLKLSGNAVLDQDVSTGGSPTFVQVQDNNSRYYGYTNSVAWSTSLTVNFNCASAGQAIVKVTWASGVNNFGGEMGEVMFCIRGSATTNPVVNETIVLGTAIAGYIQVDVSTTATAKIQLNPADAISGRIKAKIEVLMAERSSDTLITLTWA